MNLTLGNVRIWVARALLTLALLHVPLVAAVGWLLGGQVLIPAGAAAALALGGVLTYRVFGTAVVTQLVVAIVLIGQVSTLVFGLSGHPWQPDSHMYYFAVLALLGAFCDWRPVVMGAALTAAHHLVLQYVLPSAVFYQGGSLGRVLLHAVIVVVETTFLAGSSYIMGRMLAANENNLDKAREIAERERAAGERERELADQIGQRSNLLRETVQRFRRQVEDAAVVLDRSTEAMQAGAKQLTDVSNQARTQMVVIASASDTTSLSISHLSGASEELAISIGEIGQNVTRSASGLKSVVELAQRTSAEIEDLTRNSENVGTVVELIRGIASQTNLLALNATIEAARAGEMGRGFAVVAGEVKTLAAQTAQATDEVSTQVNAMQAASQRSLVAIRDIVAAMSEVDLLAQAIALAVHQQDRATSEIAHQVHLSSEGVQRSAGMVSGFESMTVRTHDAAEILKGASEALALQAQSIRRRVAEFCDEVASA